MGSGGNHLLDAVANLKAVPEKVAGLKAIQNGNMNLVARVPNIPLEWNQTLRRAVGLPFDDGYGVIARHGWCVWVWVCVERGFQL